MPGGTENMSQVRETGGSAIRTTMLVIVGVLLGAFLLLGVEFLLLSSPAVQSFLFSYFVNTQTKDISSATAPADVPQISAPTVASSSAVLIPKKYATQTYYDALNGQVAAYNNVVAVSAQLSPVMVQIKSQAASGQYAGILDLVVKAKNLLSQEGTYMVQFSQFTDSLAVANNMTPDPQTASLTDHLVQVSDLLQKDLTQYFHMLDSLLSGAVPTQQQLQDVNLQAQSVQQEVNNYKDALSPLLLHFKDTGSN